MFVALRMAYGWQEGVWNFNHAALLLYAARKKCSGLFVPAQSYLELLMSDAALHLSCHMSCHSVQHTQNPVFKEEDSVKLLFGLSQSSSTLSNTH